MSEHYENAKVAVPSTSGLLGVRETIAQRLDRQIAEISTHLENLKSARDLLAQNPLLEQFHDALTRIGF